VRDYNQLIHAGNRAQVEKLIENSHKGGFDYIEIDYAIYRIDDEVRELHIASRKKDIKEIRREAADVANFNHMIILACDRILYEPPLPKDDMDEYKLDVADSTYIFAEALKAKEDRR
jgi:hypothetical protein